MCFLPLNLLIKNCCSYKGAINGFNQVEVVDVDELRIRNSKNVLTPKEKVIEGFGPPMKMNEDIVEKVEEKKPKEVLYHGKFMNSLLLIFLYQPFLAVLVCLIQGYVQSCYY